MTNIDIISNLRQIVQGDICDQESMKELLTLHNCTYLSQKIYPSLQDKLLDAASVVAVKERYKHAKPLFEALQSRSYAVIKGAVLSNQIYGSPSIRRSGDLDILIHRHDIDYAKQVLLDSGFIQGRVFNNEIIPFTRKELIFQASQSHQTAPFVKATGNKLCPYINYDLNTSVFWGEYEHECDMNLVLSETQKTSIYDIPIKKLLPEMEFISLCLHHYKDMNSIYLLAIGNLKLSLFCDIFYYLKNVSMNTDKLFNLSNKLNAVPYIYYCLWYTNQIFDAEFLVPTISKFESPEGISLLSSFGLSDNEKHEWNIDFLDRLFSPSFRVDFYSALSEYERGKIEINQMLM